MYGVVLWWEMEVFNSVCFFGMIMQNFLQQLLE
jgi:hypothetical protein